MVINNLKINGFGKIKNKEISLKENINLIYGKNESGKSTFLKFIECMLYGISKNKNGKSISDFEKYKPWKIEEFSGKIKYKLDNGNSYEVFREFSKKNPKIYNNNLEDISKEFSIDKTKGSQFFYEQTQIDEDLFLSTNIVEQQEVVLNNNSQELYEIAGIGEVMIQTLLNYDFAEADSIFDKYIEEMRPVVFISVSKKLEGKTFVITGKLKTFKNRNEIKSAIENEGGKVTDSVSSKTNYLINNDVESTSSKNLKAKQLNIPIITEEDFLELINWLIKNFLV